MKTKESPIVTVGKLWACTCGHQWISRVDKPKACPKCHRYLKPLKKEKESV